MVEVIGKEIMNNQRLNTSDIRYEYLKQKERKHD